MLGGGQLGRMSLMAGRAMGYQCVVFEPAADCCAAAVADDWIQADYGDTLALQRFAERVDVVTCEFENVPASALDTLQAAGCAVAPGPHVFATCQNRRREKTFLRDNGFPCAPFVIADSAEGLSQAIERVGTPCVVKTTAFGYDGKGQCKLSERPEAVASLFAEMGSQELVVEAWVAFTAEASVIVARNWQDNLSTFPVCENRHRNHILHQTLVPAQLPEDLTQQAQKLATELACAIDCVGLLTVEFFVTTAGELLVNELAPRPHNSGHYSLDVGATSQFEQHIRAVCGLPLGATTNHQAAVMLNLLGDLWADGEPDWPDVLAAPQSHLHLYGKHPPKPGRKMGHVTSLAETRDQALERSEAIWQTLTH